MAETRKVSRTVVRLVIASLIVGLVLSLFSISPQELMRNFGATVVEIFNLLVGMLEWAVPYILIGAIVVVPIWLVRVAWRYTRKGFSRKVSEED